MKTTTDLQIELRRDAIKVLIGKIEEGFYGKTP